MGAEQQAEAGKEPDLHQLECERCGEAMYHQLLGLISEFPLLNVWALQCGECGHYVEAWEENAAPILFGEGNREEKESEVALAEEEYDTITSTQ